MLEIFNLANFEHLEWAGKALPSSVNPTQIRVLVYNIKNAGQDATYQEVRSLIATYPAINVLVHLSDEWQGSAKKWRFGEGIELYRLRPQLILRQYSPFPYEATLLHNMSKVMTIPLGYMRGMLYSFTNRTQLGPKESSPRVPFRQRRSHKDGKIANLTTSVDVALFAANILSSQRRYNWSHVGELGGHGDRQKAIHIFSAWNAHRKGRMHKEEMFELYMQIKFVPIGRGQKSLDCFRIYEAIMAGAIPIVVASDVEINATFSYNGPMGRFRHDYTPEVVGLEMPPIMYSKNWVSALVEAQEMTEIETDRRRLAQSQWYASRIARLKSHVMTATTTT